MGRPNLIEKHGLGPRVLTMGTTMGGRRIAEILRGEGFNLSAAAVQRYLVANVQERQEATEQVRVAVQAELQREALSDVQMLQNLRDELAKVVFDEPPQAIGQFGPLWTEAPNGEKTPVLDRGMWLKASKELRETITTRLTKAGATDGGANGQPVALAIIPPSEVDRRLKEMGLLPGGPSG